MDILSAEMAVFPRFVNPASDPCRILRERPNRSLEGGIACFAPAAIWVLRRHAARSSSSQVGLTPDIRGAPVTVLKRALGGFDEMPEFEATSDEFDALHRYLASLDP